MSAGLKLAGFLECLSECILLKSMELYFQFTPECYFRRSVGRLHRDPPSLFLFLFLFSVLGGLNKTMKIALYIGAPIAAVFLLLAIILAVCFCR